MLVYATNSSIVPKVRIKYHKVSNMSYTETVLRQSGEKHFWLKASKKRNIYSQLGLMFPDCHSSTLNILKIFRADDSNFTKAIINWLRSSSDVKPYQ